VRTWANWHRFVTLAMAAPGVLDACAAATPAPPALAPRPLPRAIALTAAEIRRLFNGLVITQLRA
jgi:hypothetical protein